MELDKIEKTDWTKENLFNQLLGYSVLGDAYGVLKRRNLIMQELTIQMNMSIKK